jgi:hypothetical protein
VAQRGQAHQARDSEAFVFWFGAIAQLGERVLCKHEVVGSIPSGSTTLCLGLSKAQRRQWAKTVTMPGQLARQTRPRNITSHVVSLGMRVRDFWHRKEEIDPSLGSAKQFVHSNHYLRDVSALAHRKMIGL